MEAEKSTVSGQFATLLRVQHLSKRYIQGTRFSRNRYPIMAVRDVDLMLPSCSTLALVGESGSGKSTLARCLTRFVEPDSGEIWFQGTNLLTLSSRDLIAPRCQIQLVFQNFAAALNPRFSAAEIVGEPLRIRGHHERERRRQALQMMQLVGLSPEWADRPPLEFSGGQRQRLAIARALILKPALLILDEALSNLDFSIQAQIANLLLDLQASFALSYLYISHDLRMAGYLASKIAVMYQGEIVESGDAREVFLHPKHPHTRLLIASIPGAADDTSKLTRVGR
jgi:ABC-type glutathione transport system ATPase component